MVGVMGGEMRIYRFEEDRYYRAGDPELIAIVTPRTMAKWRRLGIGPSYFRFSRRVLYLGRDLNEWLDRNGVETQAG